MLFLPRLAALIPFLALVALTACAPQGAQDGTIAVVNGEQRLIHDPAEEKRVCASTYCEPNYTMYASFGRKRSSPPSPPQPQPTPRPGGSPKPPVVSGNYSHRQLNVDEAWNRTSGSEEVTVAIIDSGIDLSHPDLVGHLAINSREQSGGSGVDDDQNGFVDDMSGYDFMRGRGAPSDEAGHGTHVAGIVMQIAPKVRILPLKFIGGNGSGGTFDAIRAIDYAIARGVQVINASWGGPSYSQLLDQAVQRAMSAGITFVAAAGNESANFDFTPSYPGGLAGVISVAASDRNDRLAEYSNYGQNVTIAASGDEIVSTIVGGSWGDMSGTSMASPQVAGAVALMKSVRSSRSQSEVAEQLCQSADKFSSGSTRCGRMNAGRAVSRW
jgi:subtilisin family serine protease